MYLIITEADPYVPPVLEDGEEAPTPPTQAELNLRKGEYISAKIWSCKRPNPPAGTVTKAYTGCVQHSDGRVALQVLGEATATTVEGEIVMSYSDTMPLHKYADTDSLADAIADVVTDDEQAAIRASLEAAKGGAASLLQFAMTVPSLQQRLRTHEQMVADGWFPEPQI